MPPSEGHNQHGELSTLTQISLSAVVKRVRSDNNCPMDPSPETGGGKEPNSSVGWRPVARFVLRSARRAGVTLAGFTLLCIGVAGLLLPVLPGWLLIVAAPAVLATEYSWARRALVHARKRAQQAKASIGTVVRKRIGARPSTISPAGSHASLVFRPRVVDLTDPSSGPPSPGMQSGPTTLVDS